MAISNLNQEQLKAAKAPSGKNLIIASAGTGKTSTIVGRIAHLLDGGVSSSDIVLLTFTNKASAEMLQRVASIFGKDKTSKIEAGTFHSLAYRWLKSSNSKISLKVPRELKVLFKSIYEKRTFSYYDGEVKPYGSNYLYDIYSLYLNSTNLSLYDWFEKNNNPQKVYCDIYNDLFLEFSLLKKEYGYVDYNDLILQAIELLKLQSRSPYEVLVDEYQDTNFLQHSFIEAISSKSLFCVGDYDQSIYAFNGADINIIATFKDRHENANVYTLSKNYRSSRYILELANRVIEKNERIYPKELEVTRVDFSEMPKLLAYDELFLQYEGVASNISKSKTDHKDIAVIFRNNSSADGVEASLRELGIPSKRRGGVSFFDTKEVRALLDMCTILHNQKDMMAFIHILSFGKGIGNAIAKELFEALILLGDGNALDGLIKPNDNKDVYSRKKRQSQQLGLFDDFIELGSVARFSKLNFCEEFFANPFLKHPKLSSDGAKFLYSFYNIFKNIRKYKNPASIIESFCKSELFLDIANSLATQRSTKKDGEIDKNLLNEALIRIDRKGLLLQNLAKNYDSLERFLNAMILGGGEMSEGEGINLLSVHASKGLEFDEVYIVDLMDGRFPNRKLMSKGGSLDEERRLFYVALTRARDLLYLSYAKSDRVKKCTYPPSQFLFEANLLKG